MNKQENENKLNMAEIEPSTQKKTWIEPQMEDLDVLGAGSGLLESASGVPS